MAPPDWDAWGDPLLNDEFSAPLPAPEPTNKGNPVSKIVPTLRACPFCKSDHTALFQHSQMGHNGEFYDIEFSVKCNDCGAQIYAEYQSEVVDLWNGDSSTAQEDSDDE